MEYDGKEVFAVPRSSYATCADCVRKNVAYPECKDSLWDCGAIERNSERVIWVTEAARQEIIVKTLES